MSSLNTSQIVNKIPVSTKHTDNCIHLHFFVLKYEFMLQNFSISLCKAAILSYFGLVLFIGQIDKDVFWGKNVDSGLIDMRYLMIWIVCLWSEWNIMT
jgi:hypothetical protein